MSESHDNRPVEDLPSELLKRRKDYLSEKRKKYPQHSPRASNIHECKRNIVYQVLDWEKASQWDDWILERFEAGRRDEKLVIEELRKDGFEIIDRDENGQLTIAIPEQTSKEFRRGEILTGSVDGLIKWGNNWIPFECKSISPNKYNRIKSLEDFKKDPLFRRYLRQLTCYCYGKNSEIGLFILTDCMGHRMYFIHYLDYAEAEWILKHLEDAVRHIQRREYPPRIPYQEKICGRCAFVSECLPDQIHAGMEIIDDGEMEKLLERREELKPLAKEFEEIDEEVKDTAKRVDKDLLIGKYSVFIKRGERTVYDVPEELKLAHKKTVPTVSVRIVKNEPEVK